MTCNYSCCTYMSESAGHDGERGEPLLLRRDSFPRCCAERLLLIPTRNSFFIKASTIWKKDPRGIWSNYMKVYLAVAVQRGHTFPSECNVFYLFTRVPPQPLSWPSNYQPLDHDRWRWKHDSALHSPHDLLEYRTYRWCLPIGKEKRGMLLLFTQ